MLTLSRVFVSGSMIVCQSTALSVSYFSACHCLTYPKKNSPYSAVDSERYSSLVKAVMSSRVSSQTPESLQVEDEHIYGPVVKAQKLSRPEMREPKILHPFLNPEGALTTDESGPPVHIQLNRGKSFAPSVTRILQQTLSTEQLFYLDRWKRRMVAELGEEGFKQYSQSKIRMFTFIVTPLQLHPHRSFVFKQVYSSRGSFSTLLWRRFWCQGWRGHQGRQGHQSIHLMFRDTFRASPTFWRTSGRWEPSKARCSTALWTTWAL